MKFINSICLILALIVATQAAIDADLVQGLDGETGYTLPWYSGYFDVSDSNYKMHAHYFFYPSQGNPETDPVLLWLNGGPGCSSLLGAVQEHGPFVFKADSYEIVLNDYSWNKNANVIYLESPPGVGYSTSTKQSWNDEEVANVNLKALELFFQGYSEYQSLDFFIAGESYAGIYVPTLANTILEYNKSTSSKINLKGFMVGNGCTDPTECNLAYNVDPWMYNVFAAQGWFTPEQMATFEEKCGSYVTPDTEKLSTTACRVAATSQLAQVQTNINIYNLQGICWHQDPSVQAMANQKTWYNGMHDREIEAEHVQEQFLVYEGQRHANNEHGVGMAPACVDVKGPNSWFNTESVKQKLNVGSFTGTWNMCNTVISLFYKRSKTGTIELYPQLIEAGLRVWFYSGDVDGAVPCSGSLYWYNNLNKAQGYKDVTSWRAWYHSGALYGLPENRQNGGQIQQSSGLTIVTFKGCGHMVPQDNPVGASELIKGFLNGKALPEY